MIDLGYHYNIKVGHLGWSGPREQNFETNFKMDFSHFFTVNFNFRYK